MSKDRTTIYTNEMLTRRHIVLPGSVGLVAVRMKQ